MSGGEFLSRMLKAEGVDTAFGIVDGTYLGFLAGMRKNGIKMIGPRHETCAAHMAGAYARLTGKPGVCYASNGPGVANILPGIAVENGEGNRVLVITSCRRTGIAYPDRGGTYQYFNQVGVIKSMSKWSGSPQSFDRIAEMFRRAMRKLYQGRPGVVHLDVPENLINGKFKFPDIWKPHQYRTTSAVEPSAEQIQRTGQVLLKSNLPLIHAGSGIIHALAFDELKELSELIQAPVLTSWAARGVMDERHDNIFPMLYMEINHKLRKEADTVLVLGSRVGETDWWGKQPYWKAPLKQTTIQVDIDEELCGMNKPANEIIIADVKAFLKKLILYIKSNQNKVPAKKRKSQIEKFNKLKSKERVRLDKELADKKELINPAKVVSVCDQFFDDDAIVVFDGGNTSVWGNFYSQIRTVNTVLSTFKFGMLGAGVAQALGAAVARPGKQVYCMIGDGAFGFHPQEIETAIRNNLQVVFIVFVDRQWGMVKMTQQFAFKPIKTLIMKELKEDETINADLKEIRYDLMAQSMGAFGKRITKIEDLKPALEEASQSKKAAVIHVDVNNVKHMWAPGLMHFKDMHQEPSGKG